MAPKEATVYILDVGKSTGESHNGRTQSDLDYGMKYVWDKLTTAMAAGLKGVGIGIIGLRTDDTDNPLSNADEEAYDNLSIWKPLGMMEMPHLRELKQRVKPSNTNDGDAISAIVLAVNRIEEFTMLKSGKPGKFNRHIVLLTNGKGHMDGDGIDQIAEEINRHEIQLTIIGIDFDDEEAEFKENAKPATKRKNEEMLKSLSEKCDNGVFGTAAAAIEFLSNPQVKTPAPFKTFEGRLQLGDYEKYPETALYIDVKRFFRTKLAKPPSASSFVERSSVVNGERSNQSSHTIQDGEDTVGAGDGLSSVKTSYAYWVKDSSGESAKGKKYVERDELSKGYTYGSTAVPISESEENITKLETIESFSIIGFIPTDKYERYLNMGESCITIAQTVNDKAKMALSSLIHALHELDSYAVGRLVTKSGKDPLLILMAPLIEPDIEALIDVPLPFAEDLRTYRFPPLDRVITASGALVTRHRNLPTDDLVDTMSEYVDSMDLSKFGTGEDGEPVEYMTFDETFSPSVHRINQAIRARAIHPEQPIEEAPEVLVRWSEPPKELVSASASKLEKLIAAADVKKVPPKAKGKRGRTEQIKPLSGLDIGQLLSGQKRRKISADNAIPEFKQMLESTTDDGAFETAMNQMGEITKSLIAASTGASKYDVALRNIAEMRERMIGLEMPELFNKFIQDLKSRIENKPDEMGGSRRDFWFEVKKHKLGLIDKDESEFSEVTEVEAQEFMNPGLPTRSRV